jgi:hypothetical protein
MSVPKHWLLGEWYLQRLIVHQERYSLTDSNENVGIKLSADDTFLEYDYYCRLPVLSCFQIPVIADLPVGENLQDHVVSVGIIRPVVNVSALTWFLRYINYWILQLLNNAMIIKTKVLHTQA